MTPWSAPGGPEKKADGGISYLKKLAAVLGALAALLLMPAAASASTTHSGGTKQGISVFEATGGVVPGCILGADYVSGFGNAQLHVTVNGAGDEWDTFTFEAQVTSTLDAAGTIPAPDGFTGHLTVWFGDSFNARNQVHSGTATISGMLASGMKVLLHMDFQATLNANGVLVVNRGGLVTGTGC